jgi:hypothetical protein
VSCVVWSGRAHRATPRRRPLRIGITHGMLPDVPRNNPVTRRLKLVSN